ncbi:radical SAM protein [Terrarubrum flagellatum]|uniref:B12-binding domain-containing radical SAM protein n=1 Tax=Terrirubrum flagellatum TaxID=2895980 RepID=UPI00314521FF
MSTTLPRSVFRLVLIKPSHYDDDGYVIQWWKSWIPSNSLAALYGLARDCASRRVLGDDVDIELEVYDETNTRIRVGDIIQRVKASAAGGMVMLVGVQSNQMPRALDLATEFRAAGLQVGIGGFHVSGTIAMLPERDPDVLRAEKLGVSLFAGEAEGRLEGVLQDAARGALAPLYNYMKDLPGVGGTPIPYLPSEQIARTVGRMTSFDAGRGCPYQCSFCTIINVQGRISRRRSADDIEAIVRENDAAGVHQYFITDDNFARNKDWEQIFDRLIALRDEGIRISATIQVDTLCHKIPRFIEKAALAGVRRVFIGLENINPESLVGAKKRQNKITEYRRMLLDWKEHRIITYAGYILGFPGDTRASIMRDLQIIKTELPVDILEFFLLTPLPGSEDHKVLWSKGVAMDADMNRYDLNHTCTDHPKMSRSEWESVYRDAWRFYYSDDHMKTVQKRAASVGIPPTKLLVYQMWFMGSIDIEGVHPLEVGYVRRKSRTVRRPGMPIEHPLVFYPKFALETLVKQARWTWLWGKHGAASLVIRSRRKELQKTYADAAMAPVADDEADKLSLFQSDAAKGFVAHQQKIAAITHAQPAA